MVIMGAIYGRGYSMARPNLLLFEADDATHQGYGMEVGQ